MLKHWDIVTRGLQIGAFAGLSLTIFAVFTESNWLLEPKWIFTPREKSTENLHLYLL